jgi:thioesterase domain-containing protein
MVRFLGIRVVDFGPEKIVLHAPLAPSANHRGTAFGPGVLTAAGLASWLPLVRQTWAARVAVRVLLRRCELVIHRPIATSYRAVCRSSGRVDFEALRAGEKVRLSIPSFVMVDDGEPAATYTGYFTIVPSGTGSGGSEGDLELPFPEAWRT